jgi:RNA polymerase sigma factor (sigma-70 family)
MRTEDIDALRTLALNRLRKRHKGIPEDSREDIVQDSLIELARVAPREPEALLRTIIDRRAIDFLRRLATRRAVEVPVGDTAVDTYNLPDVIDNDDQLFTTSFNEALRALPDDLRDAFIAVELRGLDVREAASELESTKSTVARRVAEAREILRREVHRG